MGSKTDINRAIEVVESESDNVTRVCRLLYSIAYTRQAEAIEVLIKYLESDERLPQVKETALGTPYHQRAIDILADIITNFPVKQKGVGCYTQDEINLARKWMRNKQNWINSIRQ